MALPKTGKEIVYRVGAGETGNTKQGVQRLVSTQPVGMGETAGFRHH